MLFFQLQLTRMAAHFTNNNRASDFEFCFYPYLRKKWSDLSLYSEEGFEFKIHKELFVQTSFMRQILISAQGEISQVYEIRAYLVWYQGIVKATDSGALEVLTFRISEGSDQN